MEIISLSLLHVWSLYVLSYGFTNKECTVLQCIISLTVCLMVCTRLQSDLTYTFNMSLLMYKTNNSKTLLLMPYLAFHQNGSGANCVPLVLYMFSVNVLISSRT